MSIYTNITKKESEYVRKKFNSNLLADEINNRWEFRERLIKILQKNTPIYKFGLDQILTYFNHYYKRALLSGATSKEEVENYMRKKPTVPMYDKMFN